MQKFFSQKYIQLLNLEPSVPLHGAFVRHVRLPRISPHTLLRGSQPRWSLPLDSGRRTVATLIHLHTALLTCHSGSQ